MSGSVSRDFRKKGQCAGGLAGRARPGWPLIKKRTAGPTPTCMGPAVLYRRIRRRVQNPVYSPNNEACLINRHAVPLADLRSGRAYGVPYGSKPQLVCFVLHVGSPTKALTQSSPCNVSQRSGPAGSYKRPCSGPAYRWHRLCNSSRCQSSPQTAS